MTKQKLNVKRTLHYFFDALMHFKAFTIIFMLCVPIQVFISSIIVPFAASQIIGKLSLGITDFNAYVPLLTLFVGALLVRIVTIRILDWIDWGLDARGGYYLAKLAYDKVINESMTFHSSHFSGAITSQLNRFTSAFIRIKSCFGWNVYPLILSLIFTFATIASISGTYALVLAGFLTAFVIASVLIFAKTNKVEIKLPKAESKQTAALADSVTNILNVKSFAREDYEQKRYLGYARKTARATVDVAKTSFFRNSILNTINTAIIVILIFLIINGHNSFGLSIANVVLIYNLTMNCCNEIWQTTHILRDITRGFGDAKEMVDILDTPTNITDKSDVKLTINQAEIDFHDITFQHDDQNEPLFQNFSLKIQPGERIGLVGTSGSGKTTITKLLLRFANLQDGRILIDGQDISLVTQQSLRQAIAYVPQESILFHRSIAENISYGKPDATEEEIIKAAKLAGADEFIRKLPDGYETLAGERGVKLSGGQRQRIAIARAILKDAPILVLDEATSALDSESEALIQKSMNHLMKNRTSIVVAHRLSTIANLDRIVVLKDGKIIEQGTHRQLLLKDGAYKKLWSRQSGAFLDQDDENDED